MAEAGVKTYLGESKDSVKRAFLVAFGNQYNVEVSKEYSVADNHYEWLITFNEFQGMGDVGTMTVDLSGLQGPQITASVEEVVKGTSRTYMEIEVLDQGIGVSGVFKLSFRSAETAAINVTASAAEVEYALEELSSVGDVSVTLGTNASRHYWTVTFMDHIGVLPNLIFSDTAHLTGTGVSRILFQSPANLIDGTFDLTFVNEDGVSGTTPAQTRT
jgi:hypothetical protein